MSTPWPTKRLKDLVDVRVSNVDKKSLPAEKPVRLCNYMDVYANDYIRGQMTFMRATATRAEIDRFGLLSGDVIITKDSETPDDIGVPSVVLEDIEGLVCGYHLALLRPTDDDANPVYIAKQLATSWVARYFGVQANGSTRFGLPLGAIENLELPTPEPNEQNKIAEILVTVDRAIDETTAVIAKQQRIKTGLMQDMLSFGIDERGTLRSEVTHEFKDARLGRIPTEWDERDFRDTGDWFSGGTPSKANGKFWGGDVPWICPKDMKQFELSGSIDRITPFAVKSGARLMPSGSVFIVIRGMILAHTFPVGYSTCEVAFNQDVKAIVPKADINGRYLAYWLSSHSMDFLKLTTTATHGTKRFDMDELYAVPIGIPKPSEQESIVRILDEQQSLIDQTHDQLAKLQSLKRGLMADLLSGDRRVTALLGEREAVTA